MKTHHSLAKIAVHVTFLAVAILISTAGCTDRADRSETSRPPSSPPLSIEPGVCVGKVQAGMTLQQVIPQVGEPDRKTGRSLEYLRLGFAVAASSDGSVRRVLCGDGNDINSPLVKAFTGRTREGIGMRSTRADVIKAFGEPSQVQLQGTAETLKYDSHGLTCTLRDGLVCHMIVDFRTAK